MLILNIDSRNDASTSETSLRPDPGFKNSLAPVNNLTSGTRNCYNTFSDRNLSPPSKVYSPPNVSDTFNPSLQWNPNGHSEYDPEKAIEQGAATNPLEQGSLRLLDSTTDPTKERNDNRPENPGRLYFILAQGPVALMTTHRAMVCCLPSLTENEIYRYIYYIMIGVIFLISGLDNFLCPTCPTRFGGPTTSTEEEVKTEELIEEATEPFERKNFSFKLAVDWLIDFLQCYIPIGILITGPPFEICLATICIGAIAFFVQKRWVDKGEDGDYQVRAILNPVWFLILQAP